MAAPFTRRTAFLSSVAVALKSPLAWAQPSLTGALAAIERDLGGRLGLAAFDTATGRRLGYREAERFPLCSTFKLLAAGLVLARVDAGDERLDRRIVFGAETVVSGSPLTGARTGGDGMSVAELCRAAITRSDNTAGNLLLASFGGPQALTGFARSLGDGSTRLDRIETVLNEALPGDPRDTTTPAGMLGMARALLVDDVLSEASRRQLADWLAGNETGGARIRAAVPAGWRVGDKTGTGDRGAANDVAILWSPGRAPILLAIYLHGSTQPLAGLNAAIEAAARASLPALGVA